MNAQATLFVEIDHPSSPQPLRLMCGSDFDVLRTDISGLEVYGKAHKGEEYLLFPLEFRPLKAGVLELRIPAAYEDHCLDKEADGARIVFKAPHGTPFFAEMPEEYWSSSGVVRVDRSGRVTVELDKADPAGPAAHEEGCGCGGHHHGHLHEIAGAEHGPDCACAAPSPRPGQGDDAELALGIRQACAGLNELLAKAGRSGIIVELSLTDDGAVRVGRILKAL